MFKGEREGNDIQRKAQTIFERAIQAPSGRPWSLHPCMHLHAQSTTCTGMQHFLGVQWLQEEGNLIERLRNWLWCRWRKTITKSSQQIVDSGLDTVTLLLPFLQTRLMCHWSRHHGHGGRYAMSSAYIWPKQRPFCIYQNISDHLVNSISGALKIVIS